MTNNTVVYWLYDETCFSPAEHGYIGISTGQANQRKRFERHRQNKQFPKNFSVKILFQGARHECRQFEWQLRPDRNIGWNLGAGGGKGRFGVKASAEARLNMSKAAKQKPPMSDETREKFRIASTGRTNKGRPGPKSDEERTKISAGNTGKIRSSECLTRLSARMIGTQFHLGIKHSQETKERIRIKKTGMPVHSEEHKQRLAERWKGNSLTKGKPWSAARRLAWLRSHGDYCN